jgi:Trk K+ transport system NAD-binding subunit
VRIGAILRGDDVEVPDGSTHLEAGDLLIVVAPSSVHLADRLAARADQEETKG